jgi:exopolysaccharide biosynthesis predicted pyruvyltransferase EpsI
VKPLQEPDESMTSGDRTNNEALVRSLGAKIDEVLGPLLPPAARYALLDFPNHANVGDSAIWLGEREWLHRRGARLVYASDVATYSRQRLAARLGDGVILLHGGGNLGDFWVEHQHFRERVIQDFPDRPIIQLPQTIYFMDDWGVSEARRIFNAHRNLTLLCRDRPSLDFAKIEFAAASLLCPDMAFALGPLSRPGPPQVPVVWLARTDAESAGPAALGTEAGVERTDWLEEAVTPLGERNRILTRELEGEPQGGPALLDELMGTYDPLARERLTRGGRMLARGKVVVTDRLHGHILCLLLRIPHVLLDNNYGKIKHYYQTWTRNSGLTHWADSPAAALELADRVARTTA